MWILIRGQWDRILGYMCVIASAFFLLVGYLRISESRYVAEQLAYFVSGGLGGIFLLGVGTTLLVAAGIRDEWRKLEELEATLQAEGFGAEMDMEGHGDARGGSGRGAGWKGR